MKRRQSNSEKETKENARCRRFMDMTDAAAELIQSTISAAAPDDPKSLRAITGALKDLKELMDDPPGAAKDGGNIVIRIEGDVPDAPELPEAP